MDKAEILRKCSLATELNDEEVNRLAGMCTEETFEVGESLGKQGRPLEKLYVIVDGLVGVYLELGPMYKRQMQSASNCEVVCWEAMIPPYRSTSTGTAIEKTKVLAFDGQELLNLCSLNTGVGCKLGRGLASVVALRLQAAYTQLIGVTAQD
ncbi:cyclic nucleotide-binding domain-containing protein [Chloroflexota bacterium]